MSAVTSRSFHRIAVSLDADGRQRYTIRVWSDAGGVFGPVDIVQCGSSGTLLCCLKHLGVTAWVRQVPGSAATPDCIPQWEYPACSPEDAAHRVHRGDVPPTFIAGDTPIPEMQGRLDELRRSCGDEIDIEHRPVQVRLMSLLGHHGSHDALRERVAIAERSCPASETWKLSVVEDRTTKLTLEGTQQRRRTAGWAQEPTAPGRFAYSTEIYAEEEEYASDGWLEAIRERLHEFFTAETNADSIV